MNFKAILLDADDTLFDFSKNEREALIKLFTLYNLPISESAISLFHVENKSVWRRFEKGELLQSEINFERFKNFLSKYQPDNTIDVSAFASHYIECLANENKAFDGALDFIETLSKSYPLYILTNGFRCVQEKRIGLSPIAPYIKEIFISETLGVSKPDPKVFERVLHEIGIESPLEVLMIGDSLTSDILGANRAGMPCVWLNMNNQHNTSSAVPDYTVTSYEALLSLIVS